MKLPLDIKTEVGDVPCIARVTHYQPYVAAKTYGEPEDCQPEVSEEIEFELRDMAGNHDMSITPTDREVELIEEEIRDAMEDDGDE